MPVTKIADVIQPELFTQYVIDKTTEKSEIMYAGVIENNPELNQLITGGGTILTMPKWNDLSGTSQVLSDSKPIEVQNITAKSEMATLLIRANAWGANELAGALAGDDPMKAIAERVSDWWVRDEKHNIMSILNGIFSITADSTHNSLSDLVLDISGNSSATKISGEAVLDAKQLMGDAADLLSMVYMHSATFTELQKQNMIQFIPTARSEIQIPTYLGYRVICDDSAPVVTSGGKKIYTTYLLSRGCIQRGIGVPVSITPTEIDRDSLASNDYLINRQAKVLHPRGISWVGGGQIEGATPSDDELANKSYTVTVPDGDSGTKEETRTRNNWSRVSDIKKIGIVQLKHTL